MASESCSPALPRLLRTAATSPALAEHLAAHGPLRLPARRDQGAHAALLGEIAAAGLSGRGGGGFPTGSKLALYARSRSPILAVNLTEGEPASAKDRVLATSAPHLVLDGAAVAAALIGARQVVLCLERGQPALVEVLEAAIGEREPAVQVRIAETAPGYVSGEESALANFLVSGVARPFFRPSKAVPLERRRTRVLVQNAETCAHVALIARHGARWFLGEGAAGACPSTLVSLSGALARPGVYEVAVGTALADVVALGAPCEEVQAVLVGGYGGGWLRREDLRVPFSREALAHLGRAPGAGVLVALGADSCGLAESARLARYLAGESAGQCGPCTFGLPAIADDFEKLAFGQLPGAQLDRLRVRLGAVAGRGACAHPDGAARVLGSALEVFAPDVAEHLAGRPCRRVGRASVLRLPLGADLGARTTAVSARAGRGSER